jgi:parvulin-like peptidyl-prolyl isomerase
MTKHQASRAERERKQKYYVYAAVAAVIGLLVLIPLVGWWREVLTKGEQPYATVAGETITIANYAKVLAYRQYQLGLRMDVLSEQFAALPTATPTTTGAPSPTPRPTLAPGQTPLPTPTPDDPRLVQLQQQYQRLQIEGYTLEEKTKEELVNDIIIRKELSRRGVVINDAEIDQLIGSDPSFGYTYTQLPVIAAPLATGETATPAPASIVQSPGISKEEAQRQAKEAGLTWDEFRRLIAGPRARRVKFDGILAEAIEPKAEQIRVRHIQLASQDEADKALARLQVGESFVSLAQELSKDAKTKDKGGELGWYPRGILSQDFGPEFEDAAFLMSAGELPKQPVTTGLGYHLIMVEEFASSRDIEPAQLSLLRSTAFDRWARTASDEYKVISQYTDDKKKWVEGYLSKLEK